MQVDACKMRLLISDTLLDEKQLDVADAVNYEFLPLKGLPAQDGVRITQLRDLGAMKLVHNDARR